MIFRQTLLLILSTWCAQLAGQNACGDPITINAILISNTTCSNTSGAIILTPAGGNAAFTFDWTPSVSNSNVASNVPAGTYKVHIVRANDPDCTLDTTIIVNNSNGPQVQAAIDPADCLASNGSVTLSPSNLLYGWSNGAGTNVVQGLASGNYYVTATNPNTGCYSVNKIFVPRSFDFNVSVDVQKQAKCGRSIGRAQILVAQGSGQYSYSLGVGPVFNGLAAGNYTCVVSDNVTGCSNSVSFTIQNLPVTGTVNLTPQDVRCAGNASGLVEIEVIPGANFQLPYIFTLVNTSGVSQSPGSLAAGTYYMQVFDADQCPLAPDTFTIHEPPPLTVSPVILPETCTNGGAINLHIAGGTGAVYSVNWLDLAGDMNPPNRSNLEAGSYSAIIYDSLFCSNQVNNLLVSPLCNNSDTIFMVVKSSTTDFYCWKKPVGLVSSATNFSLLGGGTSGSSANGSWVLNPDGCLAYSAGPNPGFALDTVCIIRTANSIGLKDTLCLIVTIVTKQPTKQSIFFSVQVGNAAEACGTIPVQFNHYLLAQIGRPGLEGTSDVYGHYSINDTNGCLSFFANNSVGFSVDEIRVGVFDTLLNECHIICYLPSVVPAVDCAAFVQLADTIHLVTTDCNGLATGCLAIPYDEIVNYTIIDNGALYNAGYNDCNLQGTELRFSPGMHKVIFRNVLNACTDTTIIQVDCFDCAPVHSYSLNTQGNLVWNLAGDCASDTVLCTNILQSDLSEYTITDNQQPFTAFTNCGNLVGMVLDTGFHQLRFVHTMSPCTYELRFYLTCQDNVPGASIDVALSIAEQASICLDTTLLGSPIVSIINLCEDDAGSTIVGYTFDQEHWCVNLTGLSLGLDTLCLQLCNAANQCASYTLFVTVSGMASDSLLAVRDQVFTLINTDVDIPILGNDIVNGIQGNRFALAGIEFLTQPNFGTFSFNLISGMFSYSPNQGKCGIDSILYRITDSLGQQSIATISITVVCDNVLVFNGISPNGDGKNDTWQILGIEQFPNNAVRVFNRWGHQVFEQSGYNNANAWDGTWNGKDLPDGTYFYVLNLGGQAGRLEGYLQILR
jgi:gliding motility-associated-like protein